MAIAGFNNVSDMKKQPTAKGIKTRFGGFPVPMAKQMSQPPKLKFPKLKVKGKK